MTILLLGPSGVGKTLLLKRLLASTHKDGLEDEPFTTPTIGTNLVTMPLPRNKQEVTIRELGGATVPIWKNYFKDSSSVIYIIDVSNYFQVSAACIFLLDVLTHTDLSSRPFLIGLNKVDVKEKITPTEFDAIFHLRETLQEFTQPVTVVEMSALTGEGLQEVLRWIQNN